MKQANILIVDNDRVNFSTLESILDPLGERVVNAVSREEALHCIQQNEFAAILIDAQMTDSDPFETAVYLKQHERVQDIPMLFLIPAETDPARLFESFSPGAVDYLIKPVNPYSLQAKVSTYSDLYRKNVLLKQYMEEIARLNHYINQTRQVTTSNDEISNWSQMTLYSIGDGVLAADKDGNVSFLNPVAERLTGWTQAEAMGKELSLVFNIVHERTRQPVNNPIDRVFREGVVVGLANHTVLISRDGKEFPIDDSAAPIRDGDGNITGAILVFRDVTDQKRAQQLQMQLAAIIKGSDDAIISKDLNGIITSWNRGAEHMYGYTAEEMIGTPITRLVPPDYTNDVPDIISRIKSGQSVGHYETKRMCKDGTILDVSLTVSPIYDDEGTVIGASKIARNITEQKRWQTLQTRLAAIVEGSDDAIIGKDLNGIVTSWNRGAERMYGYTAEEMIGKSISILIPPEYPNDVHDILERIKDGEQVVHYETKRRAKDGQVCDVSLTVSPIHDAKGNVVGASKITRDITERKARERELARLLHSEQEARTEAEKAIRSRDEFLSVAAHELRTPVTSLRGFSQTLLRQYSRTGTIPPDRLHTALSHIDEQSGKLGTLVNQLLDMSRIEAGKLTVDPVPTDLTLLVQNVIAQEQITTHRHKIVLQARARIQANIDPVRIEQVLTNLIDNAIKYSEQGTIEVTITTPMSTSDQRMIQIAVADEGEGIPPEHRGQLFERYYQAHAMSSGMGLGLYISRQIVELHGGTIHAEFPDTGGTRFVIALPFDLPIDSAPQ